MTKGEFTEKQLHGIYVSGGERVLPTRITTAIAELELQREAMEFDAGRAMCDRKIHKLRRYAQTHNANPRALVNLATKPEAGKVQEVVPPPNVGLEDLQT